MGLNRAIQTYRIKIGLTQKQLADKANLAEITIRKYESGERYPKADQIKKIAAALGVSVKDLHDLEFCFDNNITLEQLRNREIEMDKSGILLENFEKLNTVGQNKAVEQVMMLTKIPEYQLEYVISTVSKAVQDGHIRFVKKDDSNTNEPASLDEKLINANMNKSHTRKNYSPHETKQ